MLFTKNNPPSGYYVYLYLREDGTPYYVGKGKDTRAWSKGKREVQPPKDQTRIIIVAWDLLEIGAFMLERKFVRWYGRKNVDYSIDKDYGENHPVGILRNKTDGGEGASGYVFTKQALKKQRAGRKKTEAKRLESLQKYHSTVDKTSKEFLDRIEKIRKYQTEDKVWSEKALQNLKDIAVVSANNRRGSSWSNEHRQSVMDTYVSKNLDIATKIIELADQGLNKLTIAKKLNITWDKVNYSLKHRNEFEARIKENQNY